MSQDLDEFIENRYKLKKGIYVCQFIEADGEKCGLKITSKYKTKLHYNSHSLECNYTCYKCKKAFKHP